MLQGSIIAARKIDRSAISEYLREAERASVRLGSDWVDPEPDSEARTWRSIRSRSRSSWAILARRCGRR